MEETKDVLDPRIDCCDCPGSVSRRMFILSLLAAIASACSGPTTSASTKRERELLDKAAALSERVSVDIHTHAGPFAGNFPFPDSARDRAAVLMHMRAGKLDAAVFSLTTDRPVIRRDPQTGRAHQYREPEPGELFHGAQSRFEKARSQIESMIALSPSAVVEFKKKEMPCAILSHEGADALEGNLSRVKLFYDWGLRVLQLFHYRINELGDIQTEPPKHRGLTPFGRDVVKEMNRLGMIIDVAHAQAETVRGVLAESRHPVIDSHTRPAARIQALRARSDDELQAVAKKGGVIGMWPLTRKDRGETFDDFLRDIDYVKALVGIEHVGIGTDLNGTGTSTVIPTHKEFALIPAGLLARGYTEGEVAQVIGGNFMRVFREVADNRG
jgi:membrane dipeptidase